MIRYLTILILLNRMSQVSCTVEILTSGQSNKYKAYPKHLLTLTVMYYSPRLEE